MSAYRDWHVGMPVVCISQPEDKGFDYERPVPKRVYTLRVVGVGIGGQVIVKLNEIVNPVQRYHSSIYGPLQGEIGFSAEHFRPVQTRSTDISIFRALLNPSEEQAAKIRWNDRVSDLEETRVAVESEPLQVPFR